MAVNWGTSFDFVKNRRTSEHERNMRPEPNCAEAQIGTVGSRALDLETSDASVVALYDRYFDFVWRSLKRLGVFPSDLEDAAQDVFVVVHQRIDDFEHRATIKSWIFAIALRVAMAYRRRGWRQRSRIAGDETVLVCARGTPEEEQSALQVAEQVQTVLNEMDDDKRNVFVLADLEQMSGQEIAAALGIPRNTVYSRLRLARAAFADGFRRLKAKDDWRSR
jgi:RNA polymerase sigma-70 factor (ECF subfamily)